ncbi:MAG: hypothetical protein K0Q59_2570 [Paenibacillus sp.]|nr:hypothetical protein [Paenibacillus sp.]
MIDYDSLPRREPHLLIEEALQRPIGGKPLHEWAASRRNAVILISDGTRLCPSDLFLPALLDALNEGGLSDSHIRIVVALGMHRRHTEAELKRLVGEAVYARVSVENHSTAPEHCIHVGTTSYGTPVQINRSVVEADLRIATGNIEPHRLAGTSGGVKALVPGTASRLTIETNHALSLQGKATLGDNDNPVHRDMMEAMAFVPIHFLFNVIANHRRELLDGFAGDLAAAHRQGADAAKQRFFLPVDRRYDIVVASAGGSPKDTQLYQVIKTIQNAAAFTKPGGSIVLLARCEELFGNGILQYWLETKQDRAAMAAQLQQQFVLGAHKITHIEEVVSKHTVYLYSDMPEPIVELVGFHPVRDLDETFRRLLAHQDIEVALMPHAALTFPAP